MFDSPSLPFFYVLLAAGHTGEAKLTLDFSFYVLILAWMREAQMAAQNLNNTFFASAVDLGATAAEEIVPGL